MNMNADFHPVIPLPQRRIGRSVWAVFAGLLANFVLSMGLDVILHATGVYPPWMQPMASHLWLLALAYRAVFAVAGGWLTARLAPSKPMKHALILMGVGALLGLMGVMASMNGGPELGPRWYPIGILLTGVPCTWLGALLFLRRRPS